MIAPILSVKDVAASITFYTDKLGFTQDFVLDGSDGRPTFAFVRLGNSAIGLTREEMDNVGRGVDFMVYLSDDVDIDEMYQSVQAKSIPIAQALKLEYWGDKVFSVKDPDGFYISIAKPFEKVDMAHIAKVMNGQIEA